MLDLERKYEVLLQNWEVKQKSLSEILKELEKTILYFYPKDNTPWCSVENKDFSVLKKDFLDKQIKLVWVSKDSIESHKKFKQNYLLENDLISDPDLVLHKELKAFWEKNNYWKIVMWVIRSTFLLDQNWNILKEYRNVKAKWHAEKVLRELDS